jgi:acyl-CoA thioester hydrolase
MFAPYEPGNEAMWLASFSFSVVVRPRYCECDGQGHVSNVVYPAYLELSRLQYFEAAGDPEPRVSFAFQHVTAELQLRYLAAAFYDEPLRVFSKLVALGRSSATMHQGIVAADGSFRAIAKSVIVRANPSGVGSAPWSADQRVALEGFDGSRRLAPDPEVSATAP